MDKRLKTSEEECANETRQYACLRKYEKIVNQFDELMEMMESVSQSRKRRRVSRKKSASGALSINSATMTGQVGQGDKSTTMPSADKTAALEQMITKHLTDLQSCQPLNFDSKQM